MAETEIEVIVRWENNVRVQVTTKEDNGPVLTLLAMDENGHIADLWPAQVDTMERYIKALMQRIGHEMAQ